MVILMIKERKSRGGEPDEVELPASHDWRTTDEQEVRKRTLRAREERPEVHSLEPNHPIHGTFEVKSRSGMLYRVEIIDLRERIFSSTSPDFRINGLGTDKHVEAVLLHLRETRAAAFKKAIQEGPERWTLVPDPTGQSLELRPGTAEFPAGLRRNFGRDGAPLPGVDPGDLPGAVRKLGHPSIRISQEVDLWIEDRLRRRERVELRREYEYKCHNGEFPAHETIFPLYPYQREGAMHLAFRERALLADEMGLGKTIQAIAACAIVRRLGRASRVLVVTPASLKAEWEEQIRKFTQLDLQLVIGKRTDRVAAYRAAPFFTIVNYEQVRTDALDINQHLKPDIVVLDEAQRIKNWSSKTARAVKRLMNRYAFVLTGTPIENRIDELYSIVDFLDPSVFGPLFRFNRDFYVLNDRGRPEGYRNLQELRARVAPILLRRRKADVETELPERTDRNHFVRMTREQRELYEEHVAVVGKLASIAKRRPLTEAEQIKLQKHLAMMRMLCDSPYILDPNDRTCPKLAELENVLDECLAEPDVKVIIFSEWVRMLDLVADLVKRRKIGYALHTGQVPQARRRREIQAFKGDPKCRVLLCSESGGTGLNLQNASVVINCDLPWNPARLEQRIARAWRKHQTRPVTVVNLVASDSIESGMLNTLADKAALAEGVLDRIGNLDEVPLRRGGQAFLKRLEQILFAARAQQHAPAPVRPKVADAPDAFARKAKDVLGASYHHCEEQFPEGREGSVVVLVADFPEEAAARVAGLRRSLLDEGHGNAAVAFEVVSAETWDALQKLEAAGLIVSRVRARRQLAVEEPATGQAPALDPERAGRIRSCLELAQRKLKVVQVLRAGGLDSEVAVPLREALLATAQALAIRSHWQQPAGMEDLRGAYGKRFSGFAESWIDGPESPQDIAAPVEWIQAIIARLVSP